MKTTSLSVTALIGGSLLSLVCPTSAQALTVTINGLSYNITVTEPIKYTENVSLLQSQPWWGDFNLSDKFARAVFGQLGTPNTTSNGATGPLFAYDFDGGTFPFIGYNAYFSEFGGFVTFNSVDPTLSACSLFRKRPLPFPALSPSSVPPRPSA